MMKNRKLRADYEDDYADYAPYENRKKIKAPVAPSKQKRQIKNWKKAWSEHDDDYDAVDDFYSK
jgi:hypothetical protein